MGSEYNGSEYNGRKLLWWQMPVSPDKAAQVGRKMLIATMTWLVVVVVTALIIGTLVAITLQ